VPSPRCRTLRFLVLRKLSAWMVWGSPGTRSIAWSLNSTSIPSTSRTIPLIGLLLESVRLPPPSPTLMSRPKPSTGGKWRNLKGSGLKSEFSNHSRAKIWDYLTNCKNVRAPLPGAAIVLKQREVWAPHYTLSVVAGQEVFPSITQCSNLEEAPLTPSKFPSSNPHPIPKWRLWLLTSPLFLPK